MILDATAGNRMMWKNKHPPLTIFMDKELRLALPPDVIGIWQKLPFRDNVFSCVLFDPPHRVFMGPNSKFRNPSDKGNWWGFWINREEVARVLILAQKEFSRVSKRLCFKWCESRDGGSLWKRHPLFTEWIEINRFKRKSPKTKNNTFWVTFIRKDSLFAPIQGS